MADISISFTTTAAQDAKLARALTWINAQRARLMEPQSPYPTVTAWLRDEIITRAKQAIAESDTRDQINVKDAYQSATPSVQDQIKILLGIS